MVPIYVKLGSVTKFYDESLDFLLVDPYITAGALDYNNINPNITSAIKSGKLIQITEGEYYQIVGDISDPLIVNPSNLISINQFMNVCPAPGTIFFCNLGKSWYKITWQKILQCIGSSTVSGATLSCRVQAGNHANNLPEAGDTEIINDFFNDALNVNVSVFLDGVLLPSVALVDDPGTLQNYYNIDALNSKITFNSALVEGSILVIKKV